LGRIFTFRRLVFALILALGAFLALPHTVYAISNPDSVAVDVMYVNRDLLETGDFLLVVKYTISYASLPDENVDEAFIFRVFDTDGTTELGTALPYAFNNQGYGDGLISFYFDASDAPTWGVGYILKISGNPSVFTSPPIYNFTVPDGAYTSLSGTSENQDELVTRVLDLALDLETSWSADLLDEEDTGTVLSALGEAYFRNTIRGLQSMAPSVFLVQIGDPDYDERVWGTNQATTYEDRFSGTWVGDSVESVGSLLTIDTEVITGAIVLLACIALVAGSAKAFNGNTHPGFIGACVVGSAGAVMGWGAMAFYAVVGIFAVLYIGYFWFFRGA
jgi:hypothetical protein